jgi:pyruvate dehydrogenase E1 component alpha subunit
MTPSKQQLVWMYEKMAEARYYEDTLAAIYMEGKTPKFDIGSGPVPGEMHLAAGQEPCAAGVCVHLRPDDTVTATHRPHHVAIAKGVNLKKMTAEIFGKKAGLAGGRGGHMHLLDPTVNFFLQWHNWSERRASHGSLTCRQDEGQGLDRGRLSW